MTRTRIAALAAVLGGVAWIPIRIAISVTFSRPLLDLTYVEWNRLMVIPLGLQLVATAGLVAIAANRGGLIGAVIAAAGLVGMLTGVIVEFWVFGGLVGDRAGATVGWLIYLLPGLLVHVIGMAAFGVASVRVAGLGPIGALAMTVAALHLAWIPASLDDTLLIADQALIGLIWVAIGVLLVAVRR